jgi:hypothetical protein
MGADDQAGICKINSQHINAVLGFFNISNISRVYQYRVWRPINKMVCVQIASLNKKQICQNFDGFHFTLVVIAKVSGVPPQADLVSGVRFQAKKVSGVGCQVSKLNRFRVQGSGSFYFEF